MGMENFRSVLIIIQASSKDRRSVMEREKAGASHGWGAERCGPCREAGAGVSQLWVLVYFKHCVSTPGEHSEHPQTSRCCRYIYFVKSQHALFIILWMHLCSALIPPSQWFPSNSAELRGTFLLEDVTHAERIEHWTDNGPFSSLSVRVDTTWRGKILRK